jgi:hypothetical protein
MTGVIWIFVMILVLICMLLDSKKIRDLKEKPEVLEPARKCACPCIHHEVFERRWRDMGGEG